MTTKKPESNKAKRMKIAHKLANGTQRRDFSDMWSLSPEQFQKKYWNGKKFGEK